MFLGRVGVLITSAFTEAEQSGSGVSFGVRFFYFFLETMTLNLSMIESNLSWIPEFFSELGKVIVGEVAMRETLGLSVPYGGATGRFFSVSVYESNRCIRMHIYVSIESNIFVEPICRYRFFISYIDIKKVNGTIMFTFNYKL